jgi:hypothetical protein
VWRYISVIPALRKLREGGHKIKASLDYIFQASLSCTVKFCLKKKKIETGKRMVLLYGYKNNVEMDETMEGKLVENHELF